MGNTTKETSPSFLRISNPHWSLPMSSTERKPRREKKRAHYHTLVALATVSNTSSTLGNVYHHKPPTCITLSLFTLSRRSLYPVLYFHLPLTPSILASNPPSRVETVDAAIGDRVLDSSPPSPFLLLMQMPMAINVATTQRRRDMFFMHGSNKQSNNKPTKKRARACWVWVWCGVGDGKEKMNA